MKNEIAKYDFVIVGAGIVGMCFALAAKKTGFSCILLDKSNPKDKNYRRIFTINYPSKLLLKELGVWQKLHSKTPVRQMKVIINQSKQTILATDAGVAQLCDTVDEHELNQVLFAQVQISKIPNNFFCEINHLENNKDGIILSGADNLHFHSKILVAADGKNSYIRKLANFKFAMNDLQQTAIVAQLTIKDMQNTAYQWMNPNEVLALLPSCENQVGLVWSLRTNLANSLMQDSKLAIINKLNSTFGTENLTCSQLINLQSYPLSSFATELFKNNIVLIGDSAHSIHPLTGQGIALGFGDVIELINAFKREAYNFHQALVTYKNLRSLRINATKLITDNHDLLVKQSNLLPNNKFSKLVLTKLANLV